MLYLALYLKCKSFIPSAAVVHIVAVSAFACFVSNYIVQFFSLHFSDISSATRKLVFVIALPSSPSRGSLRFSVSQWRNSFGARKDNVSEDAYMRPDAFQREQWRDNVSRYCWLNSRARALTSSQMQRRNVNVTQARRHVKFARGNASVRACLCACINDHAKSVDENEYARASVAREPHSKLIN